MSAYRTKPVKLLRLGRWPVLMCSAALFAMAAVIVSAQLTAPVATAHAITSKDERMTAALGKALFKRVWMPAPSSTRANDGLGPLFNGRSCAQCHSAEFGGRLALDGEGHLAERGAVVRLSSADGKGDEIYGAQIQTRAVPRLNPEASVRIIFETHTEMFDDGDTVTMRRPVVALARLPNGPLSERTEATLIVAPSLKTAARIARVEGKSAPFGLKASTASLEEMTSLAFFRDLGLSTSRFANPGGDCTAQQTACRAAPHGAPAGGAEISSEIVASIAHYLETLDDNTSAAPPDDPRGAAMFRQLGCASCHSPALPGRDGKPVTLYSDLKLHTMGEALAGLTETAGAARGDWRTAPLIHMQSRLRAGATLLHDGRAQTVAEAILWHGGAATAARNQYKSLSKGDRTVLEQYVLSR